MDTLGMILVIVVHAADIRDRDGARMAIETLGNRFPRLRLVWADDGYAGKLIEWTANLGGWLLEIINRSDDVKGFKSLPKHWIVERTFGWLSRYRRLSKDYEELPETSEAVIHLAMINLMTRRLAAS